MAYSKVNYPLGAWSVVGFPQGTRIRITCFRLRGKFLAQSPQASQHRFEKIWQYSFGTDKIVVFDLVLPSSLPSNPSFFSPVDNRAIGSSTE